MKVLMVIIKHGFYGHYVQERITWNWIKLWHLRKP